MGIALGGRGVGMAKHAADGFERQAFVDRRRGVAVAQIVQPETGPPERNPNLTPEAAQFAQQGSGIVAGKDARPDAGQGGQDTARGQSQPVLIASFAIRTLIQVDSCTRSGEM